MFTNYDDEKTTCLYCGTKGSHYCKPMTQCPADQHDAVNITIKDFLRAAQELADSFIDGHMVWMDFYRLNLKLSKSFTTRIAEIECGRT